MTENGHLIQFLDITTTIIHTRPNGQSILNVSVFFFKIILIFKESPGKRQMILFGPPAGL